MNSSTYVPASGGSTSARSVFAEPSSTTSQSPDATCVPSISSSSHDASASVNTCPMQEVSFAQTYFFSPAMKFSFGQHSISMHPNLLTAWRWIRNTELEDIRRIPHIGHVNGVRVEHDAAVWQQFQPNESAVIHVQDSSPID